MLGRAKTSGDLGTLLKVSRDGWAKIIQSPMESESWYLPDLVPVLSCAPVPMAPK